MLPGESSCPDGSEYVCMLDTKESATFWLQKYCCLQAMIANDHTVCTMDCKYVVAK